jgi:hypothetical protein
VLEPDPRHDSRQRRLDGLGPFDEGDPLRGQVVVQQRRVLARERAKPVEVEMRHLPAPGEQLADRERGTRDRPLHAERSRRAAHEGRLARAELAAHEHHVSRREPGGERGPGALGLLGRGTHQT